MMIRYPTTVSRLSFRFGLCGSRVAIIVGDSIWTVGRADMEISNVIGDFNFSGPTLQ